MRVKLSPDNSRKLWDYYYNYIPSRYSFMTWIHTYDLEVESEFVEEVDGDMTITRKCYVLFADNDENLTAFMLKYL